MFFLMKLCRVKHWIKNLFVFASLFFSYNYWSFASLKIVFLGFLSFCLISSVVYIINDIVDVAADKLHKSKKHRPIAAGMVKVKTAILQALVLAVFSLLIAFNLDNTFALIVLSYLAMNLLYCFKLKSIAIIDVFCISFGFILRVLSGAVLLDLHASIWLLICTGLLAMFIALAKRRDDLVTDMTLDHRASLRGYNLEFIDTVMTALIAAILVVYVMYTMDPMVIKHMHAKHLYFTIVFVLLGLMRYLQITLVDKCSASPTDLLYSDRFLQITILLWLATFAFLMVNGL